MQPKFTKEMLIWNLKQMPRTFAAIFRSRFVDKMRGEKDQANTMSLLLFMENKTDEEIIAMVTEFVSKKTENEFNDDWTNAVLKDVYGFK